MLSDDELCLKLTGVPKAQSDLGVNPFQLLCHIAHARAEGITSAALAKNAKQDSRSMTGRLNLLIKLGLIKKYPIVSNGSWTYVSVYHKFTWVHRDNAQPKIEDKSTTSKKLKKKGAPAAPKEQVGGPLLDKTLIRRKVIEALKVAPRGILFYLDMVEELNVRRVRLGSILRKLSREGYIEQLVMFREDTPHRRFLCVKFLKDLPASDDPDEQDDDDDDDDDLEDEEDGEDGAPAADDAESGENMEIPGDKATLPSDLSTMHQEKADDVAAEISQAMVRHKMNFIYPFAHQIFHIIHASEFTGLPGGTILQELAGRSYFRIINKELSHVTGTLSAEEVRKYTDSPLGHLLIIRGVDFSARVKYYRYFSNSGYAKLNGTDANPIWGSFFQTEAKSYDNLLAMEKARMKPLPGRASVVAGEGSNSARPVFYGEILKLRKDGADLPVPTQMRLPGAKKRGRPRKNAAEETPSKKQKLDESAQAAEEATPAPVQDAPTGLVVQAESVGSSATAKLFPELAATLEALSAQAVAPLAALGAESSFDKPDGLDQVDPLVQEAQKELHNASADTSTHIEAESAELATEVSTPSTPTPRKKNRNPVRPHTQAFSIGDQKRVKQILEILDSHNGVTEHGITLLKELNDRFKEENGSLMDKKTFDKVIKTMRESETVRIIYVTFPRMSKRGAINITKSLVVKPDIQNDDPRIAEAKDQLRDNLESLRHKAPPHSIKRKYDSGNFLVVSEKYKDLIKRSNMRYLALHAMNTRTKSQRLRKADDARRKTKTTARKRVRSEKSARTASDEERRTAKRRKVREDGASKSSHAKAAQSSTSTEPKKKKRKSRKVTSVEDSLLLRDPTTVLKNASRSAKAAKWSAKKKTHTEAAHDRNRRSLVWTISNLDTFVRVVIICRSFSESGLTKLNWNQITTELSHWYPKVTEDEARRLWQRSRKKIGGSSHILHFIKVWASLFEAGYESGEIKLMDPSDLDIPYLVAYWKEKAPFLRDPKGSPALFESREAFEKDYIIIPDEYTVDYDAVLNHKSMVQVDSKLADWCMAAPRSKMPQVKKKDEEEKTELGRAKKSIKALIATPERLYDAEVAREMLTEYSDELVSSAVKSLDEERSIVYVPRDFGKVQPGRNFMFSDRFMSTIALWKDPNTLTVAGKFFDGMKSAFASNNGYIVSRAMADSGVICLMDLISSRKVDLVSLKLPGEIQQQLRRLPETPTGGSRRITREHGQSFTVGKRFLDRSKHDCNIMVRTPFRDLTTDASVLENGAEAETDAEASSSSIEATTTGYLASRFELARFSRPHVSLPGGERGKYIWIGVKGLMSDPIFERLVIWMLLCINSRPGITATLIHSKLHLVLTLDEVEVLLEWLLTRRIVGKTLCDGYRLLPLWYYNVFN